MAARKRGRGKSKGEAKRPREEERVEYNGKERSERTNDVAWYATTPALLRDAASVPFSHAAGTKFNRDVNFEGKVTQSTLEVVPGIMTLRLIPIPPTPNGVAAPLNIAASSVYSWVRHANSGSRNYDSPDLMMYLLAMGQCYSYVNYLQRVYGSIWLTIHANRYVPQALVEAQGVDFLDVQANMADFRYGINSLIARVANFAVPADMTYFRRLAFLFSGIYAEGESIKDQLYMFCPEGFLIFNEMNETAGLQLQYKQLAFTGSGKNSLLTAQDLLDYGQAMIQPLLASEDIGIMNGDVIKAYGDNILKVQTLPEVYQVVPMTDLTVLEQFQNADFLGSVPSTILVAEDPDQGIITSTVQNAITDTGAFVASTKNTHVLTTILTQPEAGDVMERTRLMFTVRTPLIGSTRMLEYVGGTEIATNLDIYQITPLTGEITKFSVAPDVVVNAATTPTMAINYLRMHCWLENFKFHPAVFYFYTPSTEQPVEYEGCAIDIDNYAVIAADTIDTINEAAMLALFNVPSVAKF